MRPGFKISGGQDPVGPQQPQLPQEDDFFAELAPQPEQQVAPADQAFAPPAPDTTAAAAAESVEAPVDMKSPAKTISSLNAKVTMMSERLKAQEATTARLQSTIDRIDSSVSELLKRSQPMIETLSAELARQGALMESLKTDAESALDLHAQRVSELEQRMANVLREMRELVAAKIESYDSTIADRMDESRQAAADQLSGFEERVEDLVRRFAAEAIPEEMRNSVEELSSRFVYAETALAATRSTVEFLRSEVGSLTMTIKKLAPPAE